MDLKGYSWVPYYIFFVGLNVCCCCTCSVTIPIFGRLIGCFISIGLVMLLFLFFYNMMSFFYGKILFFYTISLISSSSSRCCFCCYLSSYFLYSITILFALADASTLVFFLAIILLLSYLSLILEGFLSFNTPSSWTKGSTD